MVIGNFLRTDTRRVSWRFLGSIAPSSETIKRMGGVGSGTYIYIYI
jgi:hypothetical protein